MLRAEFLSRPNRFVAFCRLDGAAEPVRTHVPNTGRLKELLMPGTEALLRENPPGGKTQYTLCAVRHEGRWVSIDSQLPNRVAAEALARREIPGFSGYASVRREVPCGASRFDAALLNEQGEPVCFVEVKGVTLVENGVALFPDAPTERGAKHLRELTRLAREAAARAGGAQENQSEALALEARAAGADGRRFAENAGCPCGQCGTGAAAADGAEKVDGRKNQIGQNCPENSLGAARMAERDAGAGRKTENGQNCLKPAGHTADPKGRPCAEERGETAAFPAAAILFLIQREDAAAFTPNGRTDPAFCAALREAADAGVRILALRCAVDEDGMRILSEVPVRLLGETLGGLLPNF